MQDAELLANCRPDNEQWLDQHCQIGKVRDKLPDARLELDLLLTHRKLLQSKAIAIENDLRAPACATSVLRWA